MCHTPSGPNKSLSNVQRLHIVVLHCIYPLGLYFYWENNKALHSRTGLSLTLSDSTRASKRRAFFWQFFLFSSSPSRRYASPCWIWPSSSRALVNPVFSSDTMHCNWGDSHCNVSQRFINNALQHASVSSTVDSSVVNIRFTCNLRELWHRGVLCLMKHAAQGRWNTLEISVTSSASWGFMTCAGTQTETNVHEPSLTKQTKRPLFFPAFIWYLRAHSLTGIRMCREKPVLMYHTILHCRPETQ